MPSVINILEGGRRVARLGGQVPAGLLDIIPNARIPQLYGAVIDQTAQSLMPFFRTGPFTHNYLPSPIQDVLFQSEPERG